MRIRALAIAVVVALALTACVDSRPHPFLDAELTGEDVLPEEIIDQTGIDPETVRLQGAHDGILVFLALAEDDTHLVLVDGPDASDWVSGSSGESWVSVSGAGSEATYLPEGVSDAPDGWTVLSDWVIVRE